MSALQAPLANHGRPVQHEAESSRPLLRAVATAPVRMARVPFLVVLALILGLGMVGVLILNTQIQNQSRELNQLKRDATELSFQESALRTRADQLRSSQNLAQRAQKMGMRPNPYPAFITLPNGKIVGVPRKVQGNEMTSVAGSAKPDPSTSSVTQPSASPTASPSPASSSAPAASPTMPVSPAQVRPSPGSSANPSVRPTPAASANPSAQSTAAASAVGGRR